MSSAEYTRWQAYYNMRPFGEKALDLRLGYMLACVAAMVDGESHKETDFDPFPDPKEPTQMSGENIKDIFKAITRKMGGTIEPWPQAQ